MLGAKSAATDSSHELQEEMWEEKTESQKTANRLLFEFSLLLH
jgi:hypothetical protein